MSPITMNEPSQARPATITPSSDAPSQEDESLFRPSAELGRQLERLEEAQVEIDRKKVEELTRLRELQNRD